jgi:preprotein translocase subunit SecD
MRRRLLTPLIFILVCAFGGLVLTAVTGSSPELGLDLQGGVSVVLQPSKETKSGELDVALEIIRQRVDALGVAEPEIVRQGDTILVQLPGVKNKDRAIELVGQTAELRFRPVLLEIPTGSGDNTDDTDNADETTTTAADATTSTTAAGDTTTTTAASTSTSEGALGGAAAYQPVEGESASGPLQETTTTTAPATTTTTAAGETTTTSTPTSVEEAFPLTKPEDDKPEATVNLPNKDNTAIYQLGPMPTGATGKIVEGASAELSQAGEWQVKLTMRGGENGIDIFNALAGECFSGAQTCPTGKVAIALDSIVQSAPAIREASYSRDQIQISGSFTESEAKDLALVLRYGSLPVELERQSLKTVSASLGEDSLRAGIIAGIVGLALVALYMVLYYRALGIVVILGLSVWSALLYSIVSWLGETRGLALTLAGVTGIIVSVGVTVDSYVVFFERLKDEVKAGRTLRSSTERAFKRAFRTILAADTSSFLGAAVLWWLTVGSVRGFAFFLGLSTILDVLVAWFFTRPLVSILAQNRVFTEAPVLGVARGLAAPSTPTPAAGAGK